MANRKLIIDVADDIPLAVALDSVKCVVNEGRISKARGRDQYCFLTRMVSGVQVWARPKRSAATDSFRVEKTPEQLDKEKE